MRCLNCGWENVVGTSRCVKCNMPLSGTMGAGMQPDRSEHFSNTSDETSIQQGTIPVENIDALPWDAAERPVHTETTANCPHCGYHLMRDTVYDNCPNCHCRLKQSQTQDSGFSGTIDPFRQAAEEKFSLEMVSTDDDKARKTLSFQGEEVALNRAGLDPNNMAITSKVQAIIKFTNGNWYIQDQSEMQTTFVRANEPVQLKNGDIILLGNRKFIFHS